MNLNERKLRILEAIINDYIAYAEPVGSRTISKKYDWGLSSATIRNEMSDLEELGLITQPHASAGRIPSDSGYRMYVDRLLTRRDLTEEEEACLREVVRVNVGHIDDLMRETAKAIARLTRYTTVVSEPVSRQDVLSHAQLVPVDEGHILLVVVGAERIYQNQVLRVLSAPDSETLAKLSIILNDELRGKPPVGADGAAYARLAKAFGEHAHLLKPVADGFAAAFGLSDEARFYTSGMNNILAFPEFSDINRARTFVKMLEERDLLITLLHSGQPLRVLIGSENDVGDMKDCAVVTTGYGAGRVSGSIGIIGPTRMDYAQVLAVLRGVVDKINMAIKRVGDG